MSVLVYLIENSVSPEILEFWGSTSVSEVVEDINYGNEIDYGTDDVNVIMASYIKYLAAKGDLKPLKRIKNAFKVYKDGETGFFFDGEYVTEDDVTTAMQTDIDRFIRDYVGSNIDVYLSEIGSTYSEFQKNPSGLYYHYTDEEGWEAIQEAGFIRASYGTGLGNRSQFGIFTSISPDTYADGSYGDICLEINYTDFLKEFEGTADIEEPILESETSKAVAHMLELDGDSFEVSGSEGMSLETVILQPSGGRIPIRFVREYGN